MSDKVYTLNSTGEEARNRVEFTEKRLGYLEDRVYALETQTKTLTKSLNRAWNFLTWTLTIGVPTVVGLGAGLLAVALR